MGKLQLQPKQFLAMECPECGQAIESAAEALDETKGAQVTAAVRGHTLEDQGLFSCRCLTCNRGYLTRFTYRIRRLSGQWWIVALPCDPWRSGPHATRKEAREAADVWRLGVKHEAEQKAVVAALNIARTEAGQGEIDPEAVIIQGCADCGCSMLSDKQVLPFAAAQACYPELKKVAGRAKGRPYCATCLGEAQRRLQFFR